MVTRLYQCTNNSVLVKWSFQCELSPPVLPVVIIALQQQPRQTTWDEASVVRTVYTCLCRHFNYLLFTVIIEWFQPLRVGELRFYWQILSFTGNFLNLPHAELHSNIYVYFLTLLPQWFLFLFFFNRNILVIIYIIYNNR